MRKTLLGLLFISSLLFEAKAQTINYATAGSTATQDFNALPTSGTQAITTPFELSASPVSAIGMGGWYVSKAGGSIASLIAGTGSSNTGGAYNFGSTSATDRCLGSLASTNIPRLGVLLTNNTGSTLTSFTVTFTGEQWRKAGGTNGDTLSFFYKIGATNIDDATGFIANTSGDFTSRVTTAGATALDGNLAANRGNVSVTVTGITWTNGTVLGLRWDDANDVGSDDGLGIDDWSFTATAAAPLPTVSLSLSPTSGTEAGATLVTLTATSSVAVTANETVDVTVSGTGITAGDYTLGATTITILNGQTTGTTTFTVVDDAVVEGTETAIIALSNPSSGITLSGSASQNFSIDDNDGYTYYSQSNGLHSAAIWAITPVGTPGVAVFNKLNSFVVQNGNTVTINASGLDMKNITVDNGGKLYTNTSGTNRYINLYGDIVNNGIIGDGALNDGLGLNIEAVSSTISGSGLTDFARIRKNTATVPTSTLTIATDVNLRFAGTGFYNNASSQFNLVINNGKTLNVIGSNGADGDFAIDGTNGNSGTLARGIVTVNGTLTISNILHARSSNNTSSTGITVTNGGIINAKNVFVELATGTSPFVFDIQSGAVLNVYNSLNLVNGAFNPTGQVILHSTADNQCAYVDNYSAGYTGTVGTITSQRFVPDAGFNQHFISSPIGSTNFSDIGAVTGTDNVFVTPSANCDENNLAVGSNYGNFFEWVESNVGGGCILKGWKVKSAGTLANAKGYSAYLNGNATFSLTGTPNQGTSYSTSTTRGAWSTTTTLQGNSYQSGWNLVGNPFLSTVNLATKAGIDNDVKVYNTTGPYQGTYSTLFAGSGAAFIAPYQGFYVRNSAAGPGTYTVNKTECVNTAATFNKNGEQVVQLVVEGNGFADKTNIAFETAATANYDNGFDAVKFLSRGGQPTIYTMIDDVKAEYNILNNITETPSIDVYFQPGTNGNFTLSFNDLSNLPANTKVVLEDKKLNTFTPITANTKYTFTSTTQDPKNRFTLLFTEEAAPTGIDKTTENTPEIYISNHQLFVNTKSLNNEVKAITAFNVLGQTEFTSNATNGLFVKPLENTNTGVLIVRVDFKDGTHFSKSVAK